MSLEEFDFKKSRYESIKTVLQSFADIRGISDHFKTDHSTNYARTVRAIDTECTSTLETTINSEEFLTSLSNKLSNLLIGQDVKCDVFSSPSDYYRGLYDYSTEALLQIESHNTTYNLRISLRPKLIDTKKLGVYIEISKTEWK